MSIPTPGRNELSSVNFNANVAHSEEKTSPLAQIPIAGIAAKELNQGPPNVPPNNMRDSIKKFFTKAAGVGAMAFGGTAFVALSPLTVPLYFVGYTLGGLIGKKVAENKENATKDDIQKGKQQGVDIGTGIGSLGTATLVLAGMNLLGIKRAPLWEPPSLNDPKKELTKLETEKRKLENDAADLKTTYYKHMRKKNEIENYGGTVYGHRTSTLKMKDAADKHDKKLDQIDILNKKIEELINQLNPEDAAPVQEPESEHSQTIHEDWKQPLEALKEFDASSFMTEEEPESTTASSSTQPSTISTPNSVKEQYDALSQQFHDLRATGFEMREMSENIELSEEHRSRAKVASDKAFSLAESIEKNEIEPLRMALIAQSKVDEEKLRPQLLALRELKNELAEMRSSNLDKSSIKDFQDYFELRKEVVRNLVEYTRTGNADYVKAGIELGEGLQEAREKADAARRAFEEL